MLWDMQCGQQICYLSQLDAIKYINTQNMEKSGSMHFRDDSPERKLPARLKIEVHVNPMDAIGANVTPISKLSDSEFNSQSPDNGGEAFGAVEDGEEPSPLKILSLNETLEEQWRVRTLQAVDEMLRKLSKQYAVKEECLIELINFNQQALTQGHKMQNFVEEEISGYPGATSEQSANQIDLFATISSNQFSPSPQIEKGFMEKSKSAGAGKESETPKLMQTSSEILGQQQTHQRDEGHRLKNSDSANNLSFIKENGATNAFINERQANAQEAKELSLFINQRKKMKTIWKQRAERIDHGLKTSYPGYVFDVAASENGGNKSHYQLCDMVFLFSQPLVERDSTTKALKPNTNDVLDLEKEYKVIKRMITEQSIGFLMTKKVGTLNTLLDAFHKQPKIVHISCHGQDNSYDSKNGSIKPNLRIEDDETIALEKVFTEEDIKCKLGNLLKKKGVALEKSGIQMMFISACHSENVAKYFQEYLGVPVVIAIDSKHKIYDEVATAFSRHFYSYLILGKSPKEAFNNAQNFILADKKLNHNFCSYHAHQEWCKFNGFTEQYQHEKILIDMIINPYACDCDSLTQDNQHQGKCPQKTTQCNCEEKHKNSHKDDCKFYQSFLKSSFLKGQKKAIKEANMNRSPTNQFVEPEWGPESLCCCYPNAVEHNQANRFVLLGKEEDINRPLFVETYHGTVSDNSTFSSKKNLIPEPTNKANLLLRNMQIQEIAQMFKQINTMSTQNILLLYGPEGAGKEDLIKHSLNFAYHRDHIWFAKMYDFSRGLPIASILKSIYQDLNKELKLKITSELTPASLATALNKQTSWKGIYSVAIVLNKPTKAIDFTEKYSLFNEFVTLLSERVEKEQGVRLVIINDDNGNGQIDQLKSFMDKNKTKEIQLSDKFKTQQEFEEFARAFIQPQRTSETLSKELKSFLQKVFDNYNDVASKRSLTSRFLENLKTKLVQPSDFTSKQALQNAFLSAILKMSLEPVLKDNYELTMSKKISFSNFSGISDSLLSNSTPVGMREMSSEFTQSPSSSILCEKCKEPVDSSSPDMEIESMLKLRSTFSYQSIQLDADDIIMKMNVTNEVAQECVRQAVEYLNSRLECYEIEKDHLPVIKNPEFHKLYKFDQGHYVGFVKEKTKTPEGYGLYINKANGSVYGGFRVNGLREGQGYYVEPISLGATLPKSNIINSYINQYLLIYKGNWHENQPQDDGKIFFPNGDIYCGQFKKGKIQGKGILYKDNEKRMYIGHFEKGQRTGKFKVQTNVQLDRNHQVLSTYGNTLMQEYYQDKLHTEEQNIQALNLIIIPHAKTGYRLTDNAQADTYVNCSLVACENVRPFYSQERVKRVSMAALECKNSIEKQGQSMLIEFDASKLAQIIYSHAPEIRNDYSNKYIALLKLSSSHSSLVYPFRAFCQMSSTASPYLRSTVKQEESLLKLVENLKANFFTKVENPFKKFSQITAPLNIKNRGARLTFTFETIEENLSQFLKKIKSLSEKEQDSVILASLTDPKITVQAIQQARYPEQSELLTFTEDQMNGLLHSEFASVALFYKHICQQDKPAFLKLTMPGRSLFTDRRVQLGMHLMAYIKAHQQLEGYNPLNEIPNAESKLYSNIRLSQIAKVEKLEKGGEKQISYQRERNAEEQYKLRIKRIQEIVCRIICNKTKINCILSGNDITKIFENREQQLKDSIEQNYSSYQEQRLSDAERKEQLMKEIVIHDLLMDLKNAQDGLNEVIKEQHKAVGAHLHYVIGTFMQHLGLDQTVALLAKLDPDFFDGPPASSFLFSDEAREDLAKQYDQNNLDVVEAALGYKFGNEKMWLSIALGKGKNYENKQTLMSDLGKSLVNLSITAFCDRAFPDNKQFHDVQKVLLEAFSKESTLKFIGKKLSMVKFLGYSNTEEREAFENFLSFSSGNPSEAVSKKVAKLELGYGDRLNQLLNYSQKFMALKMPKANTKSPTLAVFAALALEAPRNLILERMQSELSQLIPFILALNPPDQEKETKYLLKYASFKAISSRSTAGTLEFRRTLGIDSSLPIANNEIATFSKSSLNMAMLSFYNELGQSAEYLISTDLVLQKNILVGAKRWTVDYIKGKPDEVKKLSNDQLINVRMPVLSDNSTAKTKYVSHLIHSKVLKYISLLSRNEEKWKDLLEHFISMTQLDYHHFVLSKISTSAQNKPLKTELSESSDENEHDSHRIILAQKLDLLKTMKEKNKALIESGVEQPKSMLSKVYDEINKLAKNTSDAINFMRQQKIVGDTDPTKPPSNGFSDMTSGVSWISYKVGDMKVKQPLPEKLTENNQYLDTLLKIERKIKEQVYEQQLYQVFHLLDFPGRHLKDWAEIIVLKDNQCVISDYLMLRMDVPLFKTLQQGFPASLPYEQAKHNVHQIIRIMLQTVFFIADLNQNKCMFHGNNKEERIFMSPCGEIGYIDQGTYVALGNQDDTHEIGVYNTTYASIPFKQKFMGSKGVFTKEELIKEDWYELMKVCCQPMRVVKDGIKRSPLLILAFQEAGGAMIEDIVKAEEYQQAFLKAQLLSVNTQLCLRVIKALRESNSDYCSYNFWRYFEGCINQQLFESTKLLAIIRGKFDEDIRQKAQDQGELEEIERLFMQDHWWTLAGDGAGPAPFEDSFLNRHLWLDDACRLKYLIMQPQEGSSLADDPAEERKEESKGADDIVEAVRRLASIVSVKEGHQANEIKVSLANAFRYPARFIKEDIAESLKHEQNTEIRKQLIKTALARFERAHDEIMQNFA